MRLFQFSAGEQHCHDLLCLLSAFYPTEQVDRLGDLALMPFDFSLKLVSILLVLRPNTKPHHATEVLLLQPIAIGKLVKRRFHLLREGTVTTFAESKACRYNYFRNDIADFMKN